MIPRNRAGASADGGGNGLTEAMLALSPKALWQAFKAQHFAFIAISIYLILEYTKPDQAYPILGILPFLRLSWMAALLGFFLDKRARLPGSPMNWLLLLFLAQCALSSYFAYRPEYSFDKFRIIALWVMIYFLIIGLVTTERRLYLFFAAYLLSNLKMSQFGLFTWVKRGFGFAGWGLTGAGWFKNSGEFGMEMAMFFAYTLCFALFLRVYWNRAAKWVMYFMCLSAAACVVASSSRGAVIALVAVLCYLALLTTTRRVRAVAGSALLVWLAYLVMPTQFLARFQSAGEDPTSLSRIAYWARAREMMSQHPYFGVGYYNWIPYYRDHYFDPSLYWRVEEAHNTYLQMGAELGYIGLGIFLVMVAVSLVMNWRSERLCRLPGFEFLRALSLGMNAAGVGLLFATGFLTAFFMPNYWIHFALTVALANVIRAKIAAAAEPAALGEVRSGRKVPYLRTQGDS